MNVGKSPIKTASDYYFQNLTFLYSDFSLEDNKLIYQRDKFRLAFKLPSYEMIKAPEIIILELLDE
jgi:hypothetical protein